MNEAFLKYLEWKRTNSIFKSWKHEDYPNTMVYENLNGDIIWVEYNEVGMFVDAGIN
jgi:hypothetical protein